MGAWWSREETSPRVQVCTVAPLQRNRGSCAKDCWPLFRLSHATSAQEDSYDCLAAAYSVVAFVAVVRLLFGRCGTTLRPRLPS